MDKRHARGTRKDFAAQSLNNARNMLRPFFRAKKQQQYWQQFQSVRQGIVPSQLPALMRYMEHNPNFRFDGLGATFPTEPARFPDAQLRKLHALSTAKELAIAIARLNFHSQKLTSSLESIKRINSLLCEFDYKSAKQAIEKHKSDYGISIVLLKKELFTSVQRHGLPGLLKDVKASLIGVEYSGYAVLCHLIYDFADPTNNPAQATRPWINIIKKRMHISDSCLRLVEQEIFVGAKDAPTLAAGLLRYGNSSAIDLLLYIWKVRATSSFEQIEPLWAQLDENLRSVLNADFTANKIPVPNAFRTAEESISDRDLYRLSYFFDDVSKVAQWRWNFNAIIGEYGHDGSTLSTDGAIKSAVEQIIAAPANIDAAIQDLTSWEIAPFKLQFPLTDRSFLRAALVSSAIGKIDLRSLASPHDLAEILCDVESIHIFTTIDALERLSDQAADETSILKFVVQELVYRKRRTAENELERRLSFMSLFAQAKPEDIIKFIVHAHDTHRGTALFIAKTCIRSFLERLFLIMTSYQEVLETRISICKWLIGRPGPADLDLVEELGALERELSNLEARSDLDSTRVHVDEDALREWFRTTQGALEGRYIQTVLAEGPSIGTTSAVALLSAHQRAAEEISDFNEEGEIGSQVILISIADQTLRAFAADRSFGLDAYLSRRIRHGTLSGQIMTPLSRALRRVPELITAARLGRLAVDEEGLDNQIDDTLKAIAGSIDLIRREIIQIQDDEHPEGLIKATWRTSNNAAYIDAMSSRVRERVMEARGQYQIFGDVYALCWDCLESDLAQLRLYMVRVFLPNALTKLRQFHDSFSEPARVVIAPAIMEAHQSLETRVREVCGWFIRPVFRRDSYDLRTLIDSTFSIIRELDETYRFKEHVSFIDEVTLSRGSFDVVGDALFVLIGNAAKHGTSDGTVSVSVSRDSATAHANITVQSSSPDEESYQRNLNRIVRAFDAVNENVELQRAAVAEGYSGIKKLLGMVARIKSQIARIAFYKDDALRLAIFELIVPEDITVARGRT